MKRDLFDLNQEKFLARNARQYVVIPSLPEQLKGLLDIAYNLWWVWNSEAVELFRRIDRDLWEESYHNPIRLLGAIGQNRLQELAADNSFISHMERIQEDLARYLKLQTWYNKECADHKNCKIAYFSTEFGLHESLPIYSGGLGVLSGDHLKSASDMGLPLAGVGLLYRFGYFKQYLNFDGWQQEEYVENHFFRMPVQRVKDSNGKVLKVAVELDKSTIYARVWKIQMGRVTLFLLDTDIDENTPKDREITGQLYGGDREMRIRQEIVLGIGGIRALKAMGIEPSVVHINEGHSAFLILERIRMFMEEKKLTFAEARELVQASSVFTTHTPVPAGNEVFVPELIEKYLEPLYKSLGLTKDEFLALGRENKEDTKENFCMTILALKMSSYANGVSKLHGTISRGMWKGLWPELPQSEAPITSITNGVHTNTWISYEMAGLFDRYLGTTWKDEPADQSIWEAITHIPDAELWRSHERRRERLVSFARERLKAQLLRRGASPNEVEMAEEVLDPEALTIGFARRFASYKRGTLIFRDIARLKQLLVAKNMPVQIIIAGKAHPNDNIGKEMIKHIVHMGRDIDMRHRIVFLEDYDMNVAHYMVQGTDIWLNNPRRPLEASGTSGMKAAANGVLNVSVLDGWWCEGYNGQNGWVIGSGEEYDNPDYQDEVESKALYDILEKDIVPLFYHRGHDGLSREWIAKMKLSMQTNCPAFNTNRMIEEYTRKFYNPSDFKYEALARNNFEAAKKLARWKKFMEDNWATVKISGVEDNISGDINLGNTFTVRSSITLGTIKPDDVSVQIYWGYMDSKHRITIPNVHRMKQIEQKPGGNYVYEGTITGDRVGHCGYIIRILPQYEGDSLVMPELITWQSA
ncbi:MAG: alpha-glucan phosphorylase [Elusimicrobia bacterium RIFOXYA2_FULL_50_26]|nr:MAG: alpha-glucan phosphorylase [Elusimicrobia bacterium RIFOXYA2_FULL_50_26]OGS24892.1 MAG: alpha-glucan phosphorylase [Elusimicrobia bacterium RIFOXYB2_FULL_50_12]